MAPPDDGTAAAPPMPLFGRRPAVMVLATLLCCAGCGAAPPQPRVIVDADSGQLFGAVVDGRWVGADKVDAAVVGGTTFARYLGSERQPGETRLEPVPRDEICTNPAYGPAGGHQAGPGIFVNADADAAPRAAETLPTDNPTYRVALSQWLATRGIDDDAPVIAQLLRVDLEGDGSDEILLAAERARGSITSTRAGDYAVLLLRRVEGGHVNTIPIRADLYTEDCIAECAPSRYRLASVLDLDGDGALEMIVASSDYESRGASVHTAADPARARLEWYCGP